MTGKKNNKNLLDFKSAQLCVTQIASPIGRNSKQKHHLLGLGLNKIGRTRVLSNKPEILGMVNKVSHLLKVEEV